MDLFQNFEKKSQKKYVCNNWSLPIQAQQGNMWLKTIPNSWGKFSSISGVIAVHTYLATFIKPWPLYCTPSSTLGTLQPYPN